MTIKILLPDREVPVQQALDVFETAYSLAFLQDQFSCVVDPGFKGAEVLEHIFESVLAITKDLYTIPVDASLLQFAEDNPRALVMFTSTRTPGKFRLDLAVRTIDPEDPDQSPFSMDNTLCMCMQRILFLEDTPNPGKLAELYT